MKLVYILIAFMLAAFSAAQLTPETTFLWPTQTTSPLHGIGLPDGGLILWANNSESSGTILSRYAADGTLVWSRTNLYGPSQDVDIQGNGIYVYRNSVVEKFDFNGISQWTVGVTGGMLDVAPNAVGGVLVLTGEVALKAVSPSGVVTPLWNLNVTGSVRRGKVVADDEVYFAYETEHVRTGEGTEHDHETWSVAVTRRGTTGNEMWTHSWFCHNNLDNSGRDRDITDIFSLGGVVGASIKVGVHNADSFTGFSSINTDDRSFVLLSRATGNEVGRASFQHYQNFDMSFQRQRGAVALNPDYFFRALTTEGGSVNGDPDKSPTMVSRNDYPGSSFWSFEEPRVIPINADTLNNEFWWWGWGENLDTPFILERVGFNGFVQGRSEGLFDRGSEVEFVPAGDSVWLIGRKTVEGQSRVRGARFGSRLTAVRDDYQTEVNQELVVDAAHGVLVNDQVANGAVAVLEAQPAHGSVVLNGDGSFTYTPNAGFKGYDNMYYHLLRNGEESNTAIAAVAVGTFAYRNFISPAQVIGGSSAVGTVVLNRAAGPGGFNVTLQSTSSLVVVPPSVVVPQGATTASYAVSTKGVAQATDRSVVANGGYVPLHAVVRLLPAQLQTLAANPSSVTGGAAVNGTVTLNGNAGPNGATVALTSNSSALLVPSGVQVGANQSSASFTIGTKPVSTDVVRTVTATFGVTRTVSISLKAARILTLAISPNPVPGGTSATGTITFNGALASQQTVTVTDTSASIQTPATVNVAGGQTSATFQIGVDPSSNSYTRQVTVSHMGVSRTSNINVVPATLLSLTINPATVKGGLKSVGTVRFNGRAASAQLVSLATNSSAVQVPANMIVAANQSTGSFQISTSPVSANATRQVAASHNGITRTANITLTP